MQERGTKAGSGAAIAAVVIVAVLAVVAITVVANRSDTDFSAGSMFLPLPSAELGPEDARRIAERAVAGSWIALDRPWWLGWIASEEATLMMPPGWPYPILPGEPPLATDTHLYGTIADGRWWAVDILGERPCGHLRGYWFGCEPWDPDDPWWVPAFIREDRDAGGRRVVVYGLLPTGTERIAVTFTDDSWGEVVANDRIWAVAIPEGAEVRMVAFADEADRGIMQIDRVPPDGWWMNEFE